MKRENPDLAEVKQDEKRRLALGPCFEFEVRA